MLVIDVNEDAAALQIKDSDSIILADGWFAVDRPDCTVLIQIISTTIPVDDEAKLCDLITALDDFFGKTYRARVIVRFPHAFDAKINRNNPVVRNTLPTFMVADLSDLKHDADYLSKYDREHYAIITERQAMLPFASQVMALMASEAYWATDWSEQETRERILSATAVIMIIDQANGTTVGFGRIFTARSHTDHGEQVLGFLTDIAVSLQHQGKGLGKVVANYLVNAYVSQDTGQQQTMGLLTLICAGRGSGAIPAPKIYRNLGFEYLDKIGDRLAIFFSLKYYFRRSAQLSVLHKNNGSQS